MDNNIDKNEGYNCVSKSFGLQFGDEYMHSSKHCDIQAITYNSKYNEYIILDSRGVSSWTNSYNKNISKRVLSFEAYKFNVLRDIFYCRPSNIYFGLTKEYHIKVYNINFHETFSVESDGTSITCLLYNTKLNELISIGRNKLRFWSFVISNNNLNKQKLLLDREYKVAKSALINNAYFDDNQQRIYMLCDYDVWCYNVDGRLIFHIENASKTFLSVCVYSYTANVFVTGAISGQIDIFSSTGGKVKTLLHHLNLVSSLLLHPNDSNMFFSSSLDGTIKLFSLQTLEELCSINVFSNGIHWMKLHSNNRIIYVASAKSVKILDINFAFQYWSMVRAKAKFISVVPTMQTKSSHVFVPAADNSVHIYQSKNGRKKCTILPPPELHITKEVLSISYDRVGNVVYILFDEIQLWVYVTKTDPATRVATWNIETAIKESSENIEKNEFGKSLCSQKVAKDQTTCICLATLRRNCLHNVGTDLANTNEMLNFSFLLCGLSNGMIVFLDPAQSGLVIKSFNAHLTCPVLKMITYYGDQYTQLFTLVQTSQEQIVKVWNIQTFTLQYEITLNFVLSVYSFKQNVFAFGNEDGSLKIVDFNKVVDSKIELFPLCVSKEHKKAICSIDIHNMKPLVCSSGKDHYIRVWNLDKCLVAEIELDASLCCSSFLNNSMTLLTSFKSQLFVIPHTILSRQPESEEAESDNESFVYEDISVVNDQKEYCKKTSNITLDSYLVPYPHLNLDRFWQYSKTFEDLKESASVSQDTNFKNDIDNNIDVESFADTEIYQDTIDSESICSDDIEFPVYIDCPDSSFHDIKLSVQPEILFKEESADHIVNKSTRSLCASNIKAVTPKSSSKEVELVQPTCTNILNEINNLQVSYEIIPSTQKERIKSSNISKKVKQKRKKTSKQRKKSLKNIDMEKAEVSISNTNTNKPKDIMVNVITPAKQNVDIIKPNIVVNNPDNLKDLDSRTGENYNKTNNKSKLLAKTEKHKIKMSEKTSGDKLMRTKHNKLASSDIFESNQQVVETSVICNNSATKFSPSLLEESMYKDGILAENNLLVAHSPISTPHSLTAMALGQFEKSVSSSFKNVYQSLLGETAVNSQIKNDSITADKPSQEKIGSEQTKVLVKPAHKDTFLELNSLSSSLEDASKSYDQEVNESEDISPAVSTTSADAIYDSAITSNNNTIKSGFSNVNIKMLAHQSYECLANNSVKLDNMPCSQLKQQYKQLSKQPSSESEINQLISSIDFKNSSCHAESFLNKNESKSKSVRFHNVKANKKSKELTSLSLSNDSLTDSSKPIERREYQSPVIALKAKIRRGSQASHQNNEYYSSYKLHNNESDNTIQFLNQHDNQSNKFEEKASCASTTTNISKLRKCDTRDGILHMGTHSSLPLSTDSMYNISPVIMSKNECLVTNSFVSSVSKDIRSYPEKKIAKYIVSAFNSKPKLTSTKDVNQKSICSCGNTSVLVSKNRQMTVSHGGSIYDTTNSEQDYLKLQDTLVERKKQSLYIAPKNSMEVFDNHPITSIDIKYNKTDIIKMCDDPNKQSLIESNPVLYEKLKKYKLKQLRKQNASIEQLRDSNNLSCSSTIVNSVDISMASIPNSSRLSVKDSPIDIYFSNSSGYQTLISNSSSESNKSHMFSHQTLKRNKSIRSVDKDNNTVKIKNLEHKLSGQSHRFHLERSSEQTANEQIKLDFLKGRQKGINKLPIPKSSISIPQRHTLNTVKGQRRVVSPHHGKKRNIKFIVPQH